MSFANNKIEVGDTVRIRWPEGMKKTRDNTTYTVKEIPLQKNNGVTWWTLSGDQKPELMVLTELVMLEVLS